MCIYTLKSLKFSVEKLLITVKHITKNSIFYVFKANFVAFYVFASMIVRLITSSKSIVLPRARLNAWSFLNWFCQFFDEASWLIDTIWFSLISNEINLFLMMLNIGFGLNVFLSSTSTQQFSKTYFSWIAFFWAFLIHIQT